jgi:O-antigen ligase
LKPLKPKDPTGLAGPVAVLGGILLVLVAPLVRGSDYFLALIPLEIIGVAMLMALGMRRMLANASAGSDAPPDWRIVALLASPVVIALLQLTPLPAAVWAQLPGHARYAEVLATLGLDTQRWRPASISPSATRASLLAAIPIVAAFLVGYGSNVRHFTALMRAVVTIAFFEVFVGLLQLSGGEHSPLYFGFMTYGAPIGTLGTRNEYANFLAVALGAYIWLAYDTVRYSMRLQPGAPMRSGRFDTRHALAAWVAGGLVLVVGIAISRSRAGAVFGLSAAVLALVASGLKVFGWRSGWRFALPIAVLLVAGAISMLGLDFILYRVSTSQLQSSVGFRGELWRGSLEAALHFLPLGSGWGTYDIAYRPYQTPGIVGYPNHAHNDYVEMFLEGGLLFVAAAALAARLFLGRARMLVQLAVRDRTLDRESMIAALCGIALGGFLLHAGVDFVMRVPANAILACMLAGAFLRPLPDAWEPAPAVP